MAVSSVAWLPRAGPDLWKAPELLPADVLYPPLVGSGETFEVIDPLPKPQSVALRRPTHWMQMRPWLSPAPHLDHRLGRHVATCPDMLLLRVACFLGAMPRNLRKIAKQRRLNQQGAPAGGKAVGCPSTSPAGRRRSPGM